ncbi:phosphotransferase family protein [Halobacillus andaensis]|uniref:phosphotransferase family protein n=1 Tax=Halobacillus andaensis TaxID=1176239 RepID=UPI003D706D9A
MSGTQETQEVREGEELDVSKVEDYIRNTFNHLPDGELQVRQFGAGHSNLTYELTLGDWQAVLRRPPKGPVAPKAHDMEREYTIMKALHEIYPLTPKPYAFNEGGVLGKPFFIMERRHGLVFNTEFPEEAEGSAELGEKVSKTMVEQLVELHSINYEKTELRRMVKPDGFMERQVHGWIRRFENAATEDVGKADDLKRWLVEHLTQSKEASIIHYDYKLNNAMFNKSGEMTGLFDWEMTTVGDPLADLGAAMSYWTQSDDPELLQTGLGKPPLTIKPGFYSREEFIEEYANKSGRSVKNVDFYLTFAYFKLAGIVQQIYYRYKKGQTNDPRFAQMNIYVNNLIRHAERTAGINNG